MIPSAETTLKVAEWRRKALDGTITQEELKEAILHLRAGRRSAAHASAASKVKAAKAVIPDADTLLDELMLP